ncbi:type II CAAX prenyl endopeptidase Rce1 family protein [Rathayibacter sp. SD072]|uniref:CPBP family glutamic-type intramembrane protease n=1 Tax=Rathayibacter sp. SD072 TaxID=2781731 RepID=UPI001A97BA79|nr:CPBP family glutamic-type intramembrane protease [Rathayibacter sp. SD072]MBO0983738.1 CPBP family intramembrane metalloprotease [Rathayibacter sp. SD072]
MRTARASTGRTSTARTDTIRTAPHRRSTSRTRSLLRALLAWLILGAGLGAAIGTATALHQALGLPRLAVVSIQAVLTSALVVPAIVLLRRRSDRRSDRRSLMGLGLSRHALRPLALGAAVGVASGLAVWLPAAVAGWIRVEAVDPLAFAGFLLLNGLVITLYEALPEELALRGSMWTDLRDGWGLVVATAATTALFPLLVLVIGPVEWAVTTLVGGTAAAPSPIPSGSDPIAYVLQLVLFGLALVAARRLPVEGPLLVAIAFHATQLTVTRTLLGGMPWAPSGWTVEFVEPDAIALVLVHVVVAGAAFTGLRWSLQRWPQ